MNTRWLDERRETVKATSCGGIGSPRYNSKLAQRLPTCHNSFDTQSAPQRAAPQPHAPPLCLLCQRLLLPHLREFTAPRRRHADPIQDGPPANQLADAALRQICLPGAARQTCGKICTHLVRFDAAG